MLQFEKEGDDKTVTFTDYSSNYTNLNLNKLNYFLFMNSTPL